MSIEVLKKVNLKRRGTKYFSVNDVILLYSNNKKVPLTDDPTLCYFRVVVNKEGDWNNSHAKLQLEDVADY